MTFLLFLLIALGWVGWLWAWSRDRMIGGGSSGLHMPSLQNGGRRGALAPPRNASMARRRRREVLGALALAAITTLLLARAWGGFWALHVLVDVALLAYGYAVCQIERPDLLSSRPSFGPVVEVEAPRSAPGPMPAHVDVLELDADEVSFNPVLAG